MGLIEGFKPKSLLAFIIAVTLIAWFGSIIFGHEELKIVSSSVFTVFAFIFVIFLLLAILRNIKKF